MTKLNWAFAALLVLASGCMANADVGGSGEALRVTYSETCASGDHVLDQCADGAAIFNGCGASFDSWCRGAGGVTETQASFELVTTALCSNDSTSALPECGRGFDADCTEAGGAIVCLDSTCGETKCVPPEPLSAFCCKTIDENGVGHNCQNSPSGSLTCSGDYSNSLDCGAGGHICRDQDEGEYATCQCTG